MSLSNPGLIQGAGGEGVERYKLPSFAEGEPSGRPASREYVFQPLDAQAEGSPERVALTLAEAKKQAGRIVAEARSEAGRILAEAGRIREKAAETGRAEGLAQGRGEAMAAVEAEAAPWLEALSRIDRLYLDLHQANEAELVKLTIHVAERVLLHEIAASPELIGHALLAACEQLQEQHQAVFRVHPDDLDFVENLNQTARDRISGLAKVSFEADPGLNRGDLVLETDSGRLDATLKSRLKSAAEAVDRVLQDSFDVDPD